MNKSTITDALSWAREIAVSLLPGALGATVSVALSTGLNWFQRFLRIAIGITVSYYSGIAAKLFFDLPDMAQSSVGFVCGLVAIDLAKNVQLVAAKAPQDLWDNVKSWFGRRDVAG